MKRCCNIFIMKIPPTSVLKGPVIYPIEELFSAAATGKPRGRNGIGSNVAPPHAAWDVKKPALGRLDQDSRTSAIDESALQPRERK